MGIPASDQRIAQALLEWFAAAQRPLPWRSQCTPYRVWVSEVMLQQTQVATVIPYFQRWMSRFPTLESLAAAPLEGVLKSWEGLGYYRRARLLHAGTQEVVQAHGGRLPQTYAELLKLPGIGPYTAAAIASLAFAEPVLAVDGNVKRVAARLFLLHSENSSDKGEVGEKTVKEHLGPHLLVGQAGAFNEALMELGATVCTPRTPRCAACPLSTHCGAFQTGQTSSFPQPKTRKRVPQLERYALVYIQDGALWLRRRDADEMLGGLWGFVLEDAEPPGKKLEPVRHAYTHFKITATPVLVDAPPDSGRWVERAELETLALSRLDYKILERVLETNPPKGAHEPS